MQYMYLEANLEYLCTDNPDIFSLNSSGFSVCDTTSSDWRRSLDVQLPDSTNDIYPFQVSPITSSSDGWYPVCRL